MIMAQRWMMTYRDRAALDALDFDLECQVSDEGCASRHTEHAAYLWHNRACGCAMNICTPCARDNISALTVWGLIPSEWVCTYCGRNFEGSLINIVEVSPL